MRFSRSLSEIGQELSSLVVGGTAKHRKAYGEILTESITDDRRIEIYRIMREIGSDYPHLRPFTRAINHSFAFTGSSYQIQGIAFVYQLLDYLSGEGHKVERAPQYIIYLLESGSREFLRDHYRPIEPENDLSLSERARLRTPQPEYV